jgi:hypothetical protein
MWCPHALGKYFGKQPLPFDPAPTDVVAPLAMACPERMKIVGTDGYYTVTATGRPLLAAMYFARGSYAPFNNPNSTLHRFSRGSRPNTPWAQGGLDGGGLVGSAVAFCNARGAFGPTTGHGHFWPFCGSTRHLTTPHGKTLCDDKAPANVLMYDMSARTVWGLTSPNAG